MYDGMLTSILDRLIPVRKIVRRPRPSDPWFDHKCRHAKRATRQLERYYAAACRRSTSCFGSAAAIDVAKTAWYDQRRKYELLHSKRSSFWCDTIESQRSRPRELWRSVDQLLGRGRLPASSALSVNDFSRYFDEKVRSVRAGTDGVAEPTFIAVRPGASLPSFSDVAVADCKAACNMIDLSIYR